MPTFANTEPRSKEEEECEVQQALKGWIRILFYWRVDLSLSSETNEYVKHFEALDWLEKLYLETVPVGCKHNNPSYKIDSFWKIDLHHIVEWSEIPVQM